MSEDFDIPYLVGKTMEARLDYLMAHLTRQERREMRQRRKERLAWLREHKPDALKDAA